MKEQVQPTMEQRFNEVAARLKHTRISNGYTLDDAARIMGVNKNTINRCETGKQIPDISYLFAFEQFSGQSAAWILTGVEVDETAFSLKEKQYLNLVEAVASVLARTLFDRKLKLKWQYYGKVLKLIFQLSLEFTHEGSIDLNPNARDTMQEELTFQLEPHIDSLFELITGDIFE